MIRIRCSTIEVPLVAKIIGFLLGLLMHRHHIFAPMICQVVEFRIWAIMIDIAIIVWRLVFAAVIWGCEITRIGTTIHIDRIATISRCIQIIHIVTNFTIQDHFFHLDRQKIVSVSPSLSLSLSPRISGLIFFLFSSSFLITVLLCDMLRACMLSGLVLLRSAFFASKFFSNAKCVVSSLCVVCVRRLFQFYYCGVMCVGNVSISNGSKMFAVIHLSIHNDYVD